MDATALRLLILADKTAKALADAGNDSACAARCSEIADAEPRSRFVTERTLYADLGPVLAETILTKMSTAAESNAVLARIVVWLRPAHEGLDIGHADTRAMVQQLQAGGLFTEDEAAALLALGMRQPVVTADDVSAALAGDRTDGKAGPLGTP